MHGSTLVRRNTWCATPAPVRILHGTDLLDLSFRLSGLKSDDSGEGLLVVTFGPQHVVEQAFSDQVPGESRELPVDSRISGRSVLVFEVGPQDSIACSGEGLLDAMRRLPMRVVDAAREPETAPLAVTIRKAGSGAGAGDSSDFSDGCGGGGGRDGTARAIALPEFVQLLPDRTVTAAMTAANRFRIELSGPAAANAVGEAAGAGSTAMAASRRVLATVQKRGSGTGDLEWTAAGSPAELTCTARGTGFVRSGELAPPATALLTECRLLIEEYETYLTDPSTATGTITAGGTVRPVGQRLVHADYFGLTVTLLGRVVLQE
ncbi:hypothetical protein V7793_02165 [Streptomyces sp. KLMMK]|uniref:hypothetical protein n=1 Tax=Streptomyces sp. KLMMK TaxID=3109353 RepID=UPI002FFEDD59